MKRKQKILEEELPVVGALDLNYCSKDQFVNVLTVGTPRSDSIVTLRQRYSMLPLQDQKSLTTI